jgi:hypothetical protein
LPEIAGAAKTARFISRPTALLPDLTTMSRLIVPALAALLTLSCTSTKTYVDGVRPASQPLHLDGARVVVLPFSAAPGYPETGPSARALAIQVLAEQQHALVTSPSRVEAYLKDHAVVPSEYDREPLEALASALGAEVVMWGSVGQFTPYKFDRLMPATPPYVELTVHALRVGVPGVAAATARKQGSIPTTVWNRQPTFNDVASAALLDAVAALQ